VYLTKLHSPFSNSLHFWTFRHHASKTLHFLSLTIPFLTFFQKMYDLQWIVASTSAGSWYHCLIVPFTKEYLPICSLFPEPNFRSLSLLRWHGSCNLSRITFHARTQACNFRRSQMWATFLRCANFSQAKSFVWFANLAAFFCTESDAFIWHSL
jgi:hypothetical protein